MNITIVGTGYVGLVTGACFSKMGNQVVCLDINEAIINQLNKGELHIYEPGLQEIIAESTKKNLLSFTTDKKKAYTFGDFIFICVPTPQDSEGNVNLEYVFTVAKDIGERITSDKIIIDKSTVPVGTGDKVEKIIKDTLSARKIKAHVDIVSNPEFLAEGTAVQDLLYPTRVCIGSDAPGAIEKMKELYRPFVLNGAPILTMDRKSAELAKYACNAMLATRISFMNEFANLAERVGANIDYVRAVMQTDPRIGNKFLYAGIGYGGSCFPKDIKGILATAKEHQTPLSIVTEVEKVNAAQKMRMVEYLKHYFKGNLAHKKIAIWGLAFKKNTNDMRESPAITIINQLLTERCTISAYDPQATEEAKKIFGKKIEYSSTMTAALKGKEALLVLTDWDEFKFPNFEELQKAGIRFIGDGRNLYNPKEVKHAGFVYQGIGKK